MREKNDSVAHQEYIKLNAKDHKKFSVVKIGLLAVKIQVSGLHLMRFLAASVTNQDFYKAKTHGHAETN